MRLVLLAALALTACASAGPKADSVPLAKPFPLRLGQAVEVAGTGLTLSFAKVEEDSRCAADVQCIWAGRAVITLMLARGGPAEPRRLELPKAESTIFRGYSVTFEGLAPYPDTRRQRAPGEYEATLLVTQDRGKE